MRMFSGWAKKSRFSTINHYFDDLSFRSLREDLKALSFKTLGNDLVAGVTVSLLTVPQTMAYAFIAGLPLSCGIFSAIFSAFIASFFGSSRHLVVGPTNAIAILVQACIADVLFTYHKGLSGDEQELLALAILTQMTLLVAVFQGIGAFCKLGRLTNFVSYSVIVGYLMGVVCAVVVAQSFTMIGLNQHIDAHSVFEKVIVLVKSAKGAHIPTILAGGLSLTLLVAIKRRYQKLPANVIMLIVVSAIVLAERHISSVGFFGLVDPISDQGTLHIAVVGDTGVMQKISPHLIAPYFNAKIINHLFPYAFAISLLGILESVSVAKSLATKSGQRLSVNQEIFGLSLGNLVSTMTMSLPISGSPSRSSLNYESGAKTRFAALFGAISVGAVVFAFSPLLSLIPLASLSALVMLSVYKIVDKKQLLLCLKATRSDAFVLIVTFLSCIFFSLDVAFYIGIVISISLYLKKSAVPQLSELVVDEKGALHHIASIHACERMIRVVKVEGELFFGAVDVFQDSLKSITCTQDDANVVILQIKNARDMDATACLAFKQLNDYLTSTSRVLIVCGITAPVWKIFEASGLVNLIGEENLFVFDPHYPHQHMKLAWQRAYYLTELNRQRTSDIKINENIQHLVTSAEPISQGSAAD